MLNVRTLSSLSWQLLIVRCACFTHEVDVLTFSAEVLVSIVLHLRDVDNDDGIQQVQTVSIWGQP